MRFVYFGRNNPNIVVFGVKVTWINFLSPLYNLREYMRERSQLVQSNSVISLRAGSNLKGMDGPKFNQEYK